jgi:hypothetical protein
LKRPRRRITDADTTTRLLLLARTAAVIVRTDRVGTAPIL